MSEGTSPSSISDEGSRSTPSNLPKAATKASKKRTSESEDEDYVDSRAVAGVQGWADCFEKAAFRGKVFAGGVNERGEIKEHKALDEAYKLGKNI